MTASFGFTLARALRKGETVWASWCTLPYPLVAELLGAILALLLMNWLLGRPEVRGPVRIAEEPSP